MSATHHTLDSWHFELPSSAIAQQPASPRDSARLLHLAGGDGIMRHHHVRDLVDLLPRDALLVMNDTRVVAARLIAHKATGGRVEMLLERPGPAATLTAQPVLYKTNKRLRAGATLQIGQHTSATIDEVQPGGRAIVTFHGADSMASLLVENGAVPLPPYIRGGTEAAGDRARYQCVYAKRDGAVAAPTAGLHFTEQLFAAMDNVGLQRSFVTLHVGPGTFLPIRSEDIRSHRVLSERYEISEKAAETINAAKAEGRKIIAVGTTTTRVLESCGASGQISPGSGEANLTILPGHSFAMIDGLMTNFHLPRSSLLLLVAALCGRERLLQAYAEAIERGYRFYSYGDAMLIT